MKIKSPISELRRRYNKSVNVFLDSGYILSTKTNLKGRLFFHYPNFLIKEYNDFW